MFFYRHIVRLSIWHHLFLEFWLVHTWFFTHWRHQRAVTHLKNVRQLNIRRDKKLRFQLSHRQPLEHLRWLPLVKLEPSSLNQQISVPAIFDYIWYHEVHLHCNKKSCKTQYLQKNNCGGVHSYRNSNFKTFKLK